MLDIAGRTAVVTGASRGLGRCIALELARSGAKLALVARTIQQLEAVAEEVRTSAETDVLILPGDVTDTEDRRAIVDEATRHLGGPDILVNCAAIGRMTSVVDEDPARILATNLEAPIALTCLVIEGMVQRGVGAVMNIASLAGLVGLPFAAQYSATKAGLIAFSRAVQEELRGSGVTVTVVSPGFMVDRGMYVSYRTPPPWYFGSNHATTVAKKAVRAMRAGRSDIIINVRPTRPLLLTGAMSPRAMRAITRMLGTTSFMRGLADKRLPYSDAPELVMRDKK